MSVMVEFSVEEAQRLRSAAEAVLFQYHAGPDDPLRRAYERLHTAIRVERGTGGNAEQPSIRFVGSAALEQEPALAEGFVGRYIRIETPYGGRVQGKLVRVACYRTLVVEDGLGERPVALARVRSIEEDREEAAA